MDFLTNGLGALGDLLGITPNMAVTRQPVVEHRRVRQVGLRHEVSINNMSGKKAWIIISPAPILQLSSFSLTKVGEISFTHTGDYKCQQSPLLDQSRRIFDLDSSDIYYTIFFECDKDIENKNNIKNEKKWKVHFKDKKHETANYDINLLPKHLEESVDFDIKPM